MNRPVLVALVALLAVALPGGDRGGGVLTPYPKGMAPGFLRGATVDRFEGEDQLRVLRDRYGVDTVGVYHLDDPAAFAAALDRLGMRAVIRLEEYDPETFAFTAEDADRVVARYVPAWGRVAAYLAVTMPLDDPRVQARLGGVNSPLAITRQIGYARAVVARLREKAPGLPIYLGVFYGWDGGYQPPSYRESGADGYFITNYSYPDKSDKSEINAENRHAIMRRFQAQYGNAPVIIEYGVQIPDGRDPTQTAGLVKDRDTKRRALTATTRFYRDNYPTVRGTMYFNVIKIEGDPPAIVDFRLS